MENNFNKNGLPHVYIALCPKMALIHLQELRDIDTTQCKHEVRNLMYFLPERLFNCTCINVLAKSVQQLVIDATEIYTEKPNNPEAQQVPFFHTKIATSWLVLYQKGAIFCSKRGEFKGAQSRLNGLKSLAKLFKIRCLQSVSIFSILNHPCSIMVYYYLFDVFLCL